MRRGLGNCPTGGSRRWTVRADGLLLTRSTARPLDVLFRFEIAPVPRVLDRVLNVADLEFSFQSGPRISLAGHLDADYGLEVNYFGIDAWTSSAVRSGDPPNLGLVIYPPGGMMVSTQFTVDYGSDLYSTEVNFRQRFRSRVDWLAGFRWVELNERFNVFGVPNPPTSYTTRTGNSMYGFQIGMDGKLLGCGGLLSLAPWNRFLHRLGRPGSPLSGGCLRVDGFLKAGVYANLARQGTLVSGLLPPARAADDRKGQVAFLGEVGLTGVWRLGDHWAVRGGYQVMWIEGVALAPDQIPSTTVPITPLSPVVAVVGIGGSLLYHGCHVGLEARW